MALLSPKRENDCVIQYVFIWYRKEYNRIRMNESVTYSALSERRRERHGRKTRRQSHTHCQKHTQYLGDLKKRINH